MKVNYLFNMCSFKVGRLICKLAIPKIVVKLCLRYLAQERKKNVMSGWTFKIYRKMYHQCLCGIMHIRSTVGCQMLALYCVGEDRKPPEIFPVCPYVDSIRRGFVPGFVNYQKWWNRLAAASDKVYQCLPMVRGSLRVLRLLPPLKLVAMI